MNILSIPKRLKEFLIGIIPDKIFLTLKYYKNLGKFPNWNNPVTFNEKLQWLKLYDRRPIYTQMVDKFEAKKYVANIIGEEYIIPTLGVWEKGEDINFDSLPNQFVLKTTHDSGSIVICKDKNVLDKKSAISTMNKSLKRNFYATTREWPYKNVKPRIIAEQYMVDESGIELKDYKFFCFNGEPKILKVDFNRFVKHQANYYDLDWNLLPFIEHGYPSDPNFIIKKPNNLHKMIDIAQKLSQDIPFVRIDFYNINEDIYFGEITFYPYSGVKNFIPKEWNFKIGNLIKLPKY